MSYMHSIFGIRYIAWAIPYIGHLYKRYSITFYKYVCENCQLTFYIVQSIPGFERTLFFWVFLLFAFFRCFFFFIIIIITIELTNQRFFCNRLTLAVTFWVQLSSHLSHSLYRSLSLSITHLVLNAVENINDLFILLQLLYFSSSLFVRFLRTFNWIYLLSV